MSQFLETSEIHTLTIILYTNMVDDSIVGFAMYTMDYVSNFVKHKHAFEVLLLYMSHLLM